MRLRSVLLASKNRIRTVPKPPIRVPTDVGEFLGGVRKGSKKFRTVLEWRNNSSFKCAELRSVTTFENLTNSKYPDPPHIYNCLGSWNRSWLPSDLKMFIYKFRYNALPLANRISNFNQNIDPLCSFCRMRDPDSDVRECLSHCFFDCDSINDFIYRFNNEFLGFRDPALIKNIYWFGTGSGTDLLPSLKQSIINTVWDSFRYVFFKFKLRRIIPTYDMVSNGTLFCLKTSLLTNPTVRNYMLNDNLLANLARAMG
jgi:hypothetical protein